jgi:hypothetical protein
VSFTSCLAQLLTSHLPVLLYWLTPMKGLHLLLGPERPLFFVPWEVRPDKPDVEGLLLASGDDIGCCCWGSVVTVRPAAAGVKKPGGDSTAVPPERRPSRFTLLPAPRICSRSSELRVCMPFGTYAGSTTANKTAVRSLRNQSTSPVAPNSAGDLMKYSNKHVSKVTRL